VREEAWLEEKHKLMQCIIIKMRVKTVSVVRNLWDGI